MDEVFWFLEKIRVYIKFLRSICGTTLVLSVHSGLRFLYISSKITWYSETISPSDNSLWFAFVKEFGDTLARYIWIACRPPSLVTIDALWQFAILVGIHHISERWYRPSSWLTVSFSFLIAIASFTPRWNQASSVIRNLYWIGTRESSNFAFIGFYLF